MRALLVMTAMLALGACAGGVSASRDGGVATYDALKAAQGDCAGHGGKLKLKRNGDVRHLDDYACEKD